MKLTTARGFIKLKRFKYKKCFSSAECINASNFNWFWNNGYRRFLKKQEVDEYTTNANLLLVSIKPSLILYNGHTTTTKFLTGTLSIIDKGEENIANDVLLTQQVKILCRRSHYNQPMFKLIKPILCAPKKKYEIRFEFDSSWSYQTFFTNKAADGGFGICSYLSGNPGK